MRFGLMGRFIELTFAKAAFDYMQKAVPMLDMEDYRTRVLCEYRAIVDRTPSVGSMRDNMFVMVMYAGALLIAFYKEARAYMTRDILKGLVHAASYAPIIVRAKRGKSAFTKREMKTRTRQSKWSREHIEAYPMNWYYYFEAVPGKDEYYITHKQCGICKLTKQEECEEITKYLCAMDYYTLEMQGAVLDRTKTLGSGDDECNFHVMSRERAKEIGFVPGPEAK